MITNQLDGRVYIGQTSLSNPYKRWHQHKSHARKQNSPNYIHLAMNKYGIKNFTFEVIFCSLSQENINWAEDYFIEEIYRSRDKKFGFNVRPGGNYAPHSEETKQKISIALLGNSNALGTTHEGNVLSEKRKQEISIQMKGNTYAKGNQNRKGIKHSKESKEKMRKSVLGKCYFTQEEINQMKQLREQGLSYQKIADIIGCNVKSIKKWTTI